MMEAKGKQEDYQSKLARDKYNFHHGGGNGVNVYGGTTMELKTSLLEDLLELKKEKSTMKAKICGEKQLFMPSQRVAKVEIMKPSKIEEFSKVNELPQATIEVEKSATTHVKEDISNVEHFDFMRDKNIEIESIEIEEEDGVEEKERLMSENLKDYDIEKDENMKENECFIEKQEITEEQQKEKEVVALDKSEVVRVFTNQTNSILLRNSSCVQNFSMQNMENERNLDYHIYKAISFFTLTYYLRFDHFLKGTKFNPFTLFFYRISHGHPCTWTLMLGRNHTMDFEELGEIVWIRAIPSGRVWSREGLQTTYQQS
ncbi:hypothetical protein M9H77_07483 [Catharanthus roseus]|uniref:Uncharacterized protein n=1 Tax=Catharanthus roseus TaxID=4058 RepID=A0ACC0BVC0_CATRO|nr:hypothetical protein M9H77_07483 [Catharanthus roseus]